MEYINNYDSDSDSDSVNNIDIINYNVSIAEILDEKDKELITIKEKLYNTQINLKDTTRVLEETLLANSKDQNMKTNNIINRNNRKTEVLSLESKYPYKKKPDNYKWFFCWKRGILFIIEKKPKKKHEHIPIGTEDHNN